MQIQAIRASKRDQQCVCVVYQKKKRNPAKKFKKNYNKNNSNKQKCRRR